MAPNTFNHEVWIAYSDDGATWSFPEEDIPFEGSVPDILRRDNTLYAFGGRGTIKRYHFDTDEWEDPVEYSTTGERHPMERQITRFGRRWIDSFVFSFIRD